MIDRQSGKTLDIDGFNYSDGANICPIAVPDPTSISKARFARPDLLQAGRFFSGEGPFQRCRRLKCDKYIHAERYLCIFLCVGMWGVNALFKSKAG